MRERKNPATCSNRSGAVAIVGKDDHMQNPTCTLPKCERKLLRQGWCSMHYWRWYRNGDPLHPVIPRFDDTATAFRERTRKVGSCLIWTGCITSRGYGSIRYEGRMRSTHIVAFIMKNGPIPSGMEVDHKCHTPACVNTDHLRLATRKQNQENKAGAYRTSKTGIRGVHWHAITGKWAVACRHNGKVHHAGLFVDIKEAEAAAIALRNSLYTHNLLDRQ